MGGTGLGGRCARLVGEVMEEVEDRPGKWWQRPVEPRSRIVAYAMCQGGGEPPGGVSRRLGPVESILARWRRADRRTPAEGLRRPSTAVDTLPAHGGSFAIGKASGHASDGRRYALGKELANPSRSYGTVLDHPEASPNS